MACSASRDEHGTTYHIPAAATVKSPGGALFPGTAAVDVWWSRHFKGKQDEKLLLVQENNPEQNDVIVLTLGQVYDLIHALGWSVMRT